MQRPPRNRVGPMLLFWTEAYRTRSDTARDHLLQADKRAAADEEDVGGVHRREFLMRVLSTALRGNVSHRTLEDLEKRLLHAFTRYIAGDRRVFVLAADFVDLVDVNDALLSPLNVPIGVLEQPEDNVLDVFADIPRFGEGGSIDDRERHVENPRQGLGQKR